MRLWVASSNRLRGSQVIRRRTASGETMAEFLRWLNDQVGENHSTWIWSHAAVTDWTQLGLWEAIDEGQIVLLDAILAGPPNLLFCSFRGRNVLFIDSSNWFRATVSALAVIAGCSGVPRPADHEDATYWSEWAEHERDVIEATVLAVIAWVKSADLGMLRHTAPAQALASWRHWHPGPWPEPHDCPQVSAHERLAYFGGRAELGFQGLVKAEYPGRYRAQAERHEHGAVLYNTQAHVFDATAFYPSMMKARQYPYCFTHALDSCSHDALWTLLSEKAAIAHVLIRSDDRAYPVRRNGQVYYATGEFATALAGPELAQALHYGDIARIGYTSVYKTADLFTPWVDRLWKYRQQFEAESNRPWTALVKLLSNSLYGKFTQTSGGWQNTPEHPCRERWGIWLEAHPDHPGAQEYRGIAGLCQAKVASGEHAQAVVSIGAYVTSFGRVLMEDWRNCLPANSLLYSDTDSLHVTRAGAQALEASGHLGQAGLGALKAKCNAQEAEYRNLKLYRLDSEVFAGGLHQADPQSGQFPSLAFYQERIESLLRRCRDGTVRVATELLTLAAEYSHGQVGSDGWTRPFEAPCEQVPTYPPAPADPL